MSNLHVSSPVRFPCPRPVDSASPPICGAARQVSALRFGNNLLPPASRKELRFPSHKTLQDVGRSTITPAASYTSREESATDVHARREDEEHGATQLILLLTLSVVLLTLPWVVDHPVTLLVPVALFILPITSDALRSLVSEGLALISSGIRWFWRHRKTGRGYATVQPVAAAAPSRATQMQPSTQHAHVRHAYQPPRASAFGNRQQPESWQASTSSLPYVPARVHVESPIKATGVQPGLMARGGGLPEKPDWQPVVPRPHSVAQPLVLCAQSNAVPPELITPDLDFDSDNETVVHEDIHGRSAYGSMLSSQGTYGSGQVQPGHVQSMQQRNMPSSAHPRPASKIRPVEQAECTVYNWDEVEECTQRRGHRPLSDLLNNVQ